MQHLEYMLEHMPERIRKRTTRKTYVPGETIVQKGDRANLAVLLTKGRIRVCTEFANGQRFIFGSMEVPDLIGDLEILAEQEYYSATNEAVTDCEGIAMRADTFLEWMRLDNDFAVSVAKRLAAKMYPTSKEAGRVKFLPSLERLQDYIVKRLGSIKTDTFILHTSRQQIADDIGTSVKTVNRCVTKLKDAGLISLFHGKIMLNNEQQEILRANSLNDNK